MVDEVRDRYGPPPTAVLNLADFARIRVLADSLGVETIDRADPTRGVQVPADRTKVDPMHVIALVQERGDLQLVAARTPSSSIFVTGSRSGSREPESQQQPSAGSRLRLTETSRSRPRSSESRPGGPRGPRPER